MKLTYKKANQIFIIFLILLFITSFLQIDDKLSSFISNYFTIILLLFLLSLSVIVYDFLYFININKNQKNKIKYQQEEIVNKLTKLSYEEKNILSLFINNKTQEKSLNPNEQAVAWLESIKFIYSTGKIEGNKKIYRIEPSLSKILTQNPNYLY